MAKVLFSMEVIVLFFVVPLLPDFPSPLYSTGLVLLALTAGLPVVVVACVWPPGTVLKAFQDALGHKRLGSASLPSLRVWRMVLEVFPWTSLAVLVRSSTSVVAIAGPPPVLLLVTLSWSALGFTLFSILREVVTSLADTTARAETPVPSDGFVDHYKLTPREVEVSILLIRGLSYRQIADTLFISPSTAKTHCLHIYEKTGVSTKGDLALAVREYID